MKAFATALTTLLAAALMHNIDWKIRAPLPEGVSGGALARLSGKLWYVGGTTWRKDVKYWRRETDIYTIASDSWSAGPPLPEPLAYGAYLTNAKTIEIFGGVNTDGISLHSWRLSEDGTQWIVSGLMPAPTVFAKAAVLRGVPYLFGGCKDAADLRDCSDSVWRRVSGGEWVHAGSMPQGRVAMPALAVSEDRVYLFSGCSANPSGDVTNRADAYAYDPASNQWKTLKPVPQPIRGMTAVPLNGRQILLLGGVEGRPSSPPEFSKAVYVYDTAQDQYQQIDSLPFAVMGMEAVFDGQALWGAGGEDKARSRSQRLIQGIVPSK